MKTSSTWHILRPLLKGMEMAGADTDVVHIRQLDLEPCIGCYTCWVRTPGICIHHDPMEQVLKKFNSADLIVYGTPLYHFSMSGIMKTFIDRTLPLMEPWLVPHSTEEGLTGHPVRDDHKAKMLLVSPCGFPEFEHFESLVATFKHIARMHGIEYVGEILRPFAEALSRRETQFLFKSFYDNLEKAGRQIIEVGRIAEETQSELRKDLFPGGKEVLYRLSDGYWTKQMDRFKVPIKARDLDALEAARRPKPLLHSEIESTQLFAIEGVGQERSTVAREESGISNKQIAESMAGMYREKEVPGLRATVELHLLNTDGDLDPGPQDWVIELGPNGAIAEEGRTVFPTLSISTPREVWRDIGLGKLDPETAFVDGLYEVTGNMNLLRIFPKIFAYSKVRQRGEVNENSEYSTELATVPLPVLFAGMAARFDPDVGRHMEATIQFDVTDEDPGHHHIEISGDTATYREGMANDADLTIQTPSEVWRQVSSGELDGAEALTAGKYSVNGDFSLLIKLKDLFGSGNPEQ